MILIWNIRCLYEQIYDFKNKIYDFNMKICDVDVKNKKRKDMILIFKLFYFDMKNMILIIENVWFRYEKAQFWNWQSMILIRKMSDFDVKNIILICKCMILIWTFMILIWRYIIPIWKCMILIWKLKNNEYDNEWFLTHKYKFCYEICDFVM